MRLFIAAITVLAITAVIVVGCQKNDEPDVSKLIEKEVKPAVEAVTQ